ncbi:ABC transporter ATP-binding protein [Allostreptomyces psammosilenae]|uniref:Peptide/nickel transport system ATP-binding protein n=1 Tax=Allostreptomyces psammosilenae TaxID=1892865 RepID=A0A852ZX09_9ACTN|nr:ATP-binding cassette domain-containing protein [Allostreptomyces psammosilenae]NYI06739.1 peptide/nickel transport system ATP-binding protein [Allostreptomyces psammosilenae]
MTEYRGRDGASLTARGITAGYDPRRPVVRDATLVLPAGSVLGLVGPSGCGKSTLARVAALLHAPYAGTVLVDGTPAPGARYRAPRELRTAVGVVFQSPRAAVDPRLRLRDVIAEPLRATGRGGEAADRVAELAELVGLTGELLERRPHAVSDGQLQRACLARALVARPRYLVCDEMTSMLDASTTAALVGVVRDYQAATGCGVLAVSHDAELLGRWADRTVELAELSGAAGGAPG